MLKIISTEQFEMVGTDGRFIHCASVHNVRNFKEYIYMYDTVQHKKYVEEITGGVLREVEDPERWQELVDYGQLHNLWPAVIMKQ